MVHLPGSPTAFAASVWQPTQGPSKYLQKLTHFLFLSGVFLVHKTTELNKTCIWNEKGRRKPLLLYVNAQLSSCHGN